jgi:ADP-ribosylglycohydrolase
VRAAPIFHAYSYSYIDSSIGYTFKCLASGIWALRQALAAKQEALATKSTPSFPSIFERIITKLTMAGGDSDTNGAVAGSLLGAGFGYSNLPAQWVQDLKHRDWLLSKVDASIYLSLGEGTPYDSKKDQDNLVDGGKGYMTQEEVDKQWGAFKEMRYKRMVDYTE